MGEGDRITISPDAVEDNGKWRRFFDGDGGWIGEPPEGIIIEVVNDTEEGIDLRVQWDKGPRAGHVTRIPLSEFVDLARKRPAKLAGRIYKHTLAYVAGVKPCRE